MSGQEIACMIVYYGKTVWAGLFFFNFLFNFLIIVVLLTDIKVYVRYRQVSFYPF